LKNARLQYLADKMRQGFGFSGKDELDLAGKGARRSAAELLGKKRIKVAVFAILFGVSSALIDMPLPAEDAYTAARARLRVRAAPQDIAMIAIDDATLNELGVPLPSRREDSKLIDRLVAAGVKKVVFDRAHADPETPATDALFAQMLERHRGKVWLGMAPRIEVGFTVLDPITPLKQFSDHAPAASMTGFSNPFGLSMILNTEVELKRQTFPSIAAVLGDYDGPARRFRPDLAFIPSTIPSYSYAAVLNGRVGPRELAGKSVVIGKTFQGSSDIHRHPLYGRVPGSYYHILGAHTLKRNTPLDLLWFPAMIIASVALAMQAVSRRRNSRPLQVAVLILLVVPFLLDEFAIHVDVMSALLALGGAAFAFARLNRKYYSSGVDAMTTSAISSDQPSGERDVYALKIANLAELSEDWSEREIGDFVNTLISYVRGPGEVGDIAFERDLLVWLAPRMETVELERHADGLAMMLKTAISHDWQSSQGAPALGIDTNYELPVAVRIKKAMQAADEAGTRGVRFIINDAAHLEARNHRLELIRVLEKGLRDRDVGVAYQPKIDLASGRIVGAETLIRWQPDGGEFVNPQDLVLAAEAGDRINELTLVVMEAALLDGKQAIALDPRFKLAVNMSAKSLSDTHLLFDIMTLLGRFGFPPENLTLELTETAKLEDHRIAPQIAALKARGICLSIDDFGTGQSNLEYIEKLPSSELKIDKRFVQHMASSEESRAVVRATIEIAHSLGKIVVAEGVEDLSVAAALRAMGCDQAQGYLFSRAIAMPELLAMMGGGQTALNA
jgi:EAL domain-containing protein (putative c-di-GMP-specific phosphodiesterase class I)/CHASE2 domain-containing sensor protein